jgi:hypothetical protein
VSSSLIGEACPLPEPNYKRLISTIDDFLALPRGAKRAFSLSATVVIATWMFEELGRVWLLPDVSHDEYDAYMNKHLMGTIVKVRPFARPCCAAWWRRYFTRI